MKFAVKITIKIWKKKLIKYSFKKTNELITYHIYITWRKRLHIQKRTLMRLKIRDEFFIFLLQSTYYISKYKL